MGYEIDRDALSKLRNLDDETMSNIIRKNCRRVRYE